MKIYRMIGIYGKINYICLTDFNRKKLLNLKQIQPASIFIKPNFAMQRQKIVHADKKANYFIYAGRLEKIKGTDILLEAWNLIGADSPKLIICGTGPLENWCRNYILSNKINAKMLGFMCHDETIELIAYAKALILPTQCYEGFPMTIAEAFSVGTPVICSDIGNAGNIVEEGKTGLKFKYNSPEDLAGIVKNFDSLNINLGENSRLKFNKDFSTENNYRILMNIYEAIKNYER